MSERKPKKGIQRTERQLAVGILGMASNTRLSDLCEQIVDCPHSTPVWTDSGVVVLRSQNIKNGRLDLSDPSYTDERNFDARTRRSVPSVGDLVITREAPMGEVCMIPQGLRCCLGQRMVMLRPDRKKVDSRFLLYALQSRSVRHEILVNEGTGSTVSNLRIPLLEALPIPTLRLPEQKAIAHVLGTLDDKIELNRKMNETLEAMARALFKSWFVDFDPVRAKAEGRDPGLPAHIAALFPDSFEDSELGEIPEGWKTKPIGDLAKVQGGSTPSTKEPSYWEDGIHFWATPKDLSGLSSPVLLGTGRKITDAGLIQISSGLLPAGTVLLSSRAPIGYLAVAEIPVAINQGFIAMQALKGVSNLFLLLWAEVAHDRIVSRANGSTFLEISKSSFRPIPVVVPRASVMNAFDRVVRPMYSRIVANERESQILRDTRDALLPRLISGELRIRVF
jgi:type I restriction enzyme S subunit